MCIITAKGTADIRTIDMELPDIKANIDCKSVAKLKAVTGLAEKHGISDRIFYTGI